MNSGHLSEALCKLTLFPLIPNGVATWQGWVAAEGEEEASKARAADPGGVRAEQEERVSGTLLLSEAPGSSSGHKQGMKRAVKIMIWCIS